LAKNTAVRHGDLKINIVDTPGHADFGGEVERGLTMVDGVLLLVDASEGPLPQTRFVLRKSLEARLPVVLVVNKIDRPDARTMEVVDEVYQLFLDLDADEHQIEFPILYADAREGRCGPNPSALPEDLEPLFDALREHIPAPSYEEGHPLQALVTNLDASPYVGRLALCRVRNGTIRRGQEVAWCRADGTIEPAKVAELYVTDALDRVEADEAGPGEIVAVAGIDEITIGETLADPDDPRPLPVTRVDEPSLSMTIGINTSPLAGRDGTRLTAPQVKARLDQEVIGNVSIRVLDGDRPDRWEVQGRGELQLAVLVEVMRREGFELTVGQAAGRHARDRWEAARTRGTRRDRRARGVPRRDHSVARAPQGSDGEHGEPRHWVDPHGAPRARARPDRVPDRVPDRDARDRAAPSRVRGLRAVARRAPHPPDRFARRRPRGREHVVHAPHAPGARVDVRRPGRGRLRGHGRGRERAIRGHRREPDEEKKLTNMRQANSEEFTRLIPKRTLVLEQALEFIREDECVEVTPGNVRLRKVTLPQQERAKAARRGRPPRRPDLDRASDPPLHTIATSRSWTPPNSDHPRSNQSRNGR
jgi:GTP-binding protein